jgi:zinc transport system substrate-binding protein
LSGAPAASPPRCARDLGLKTDVLDPIEGITDSSRGTDYLSVMTSNLTALRTANGCR